MSLGEDAAGEEWIGTVAAAAALGVHRTAVNTMILDGRLPAQRDGASWLIPVAEFERFREAYVRPPNVPPRDQSSGDLAPCTRRVLTWLYRWGEATTAELAEALSDHPGNIRKGALMLLRRELAERDDMRVWRLTAEGAALARRFSVDPDELD